MSDADADIVGEVVGARYEIRELLGTGAVGQVYLAENLDSGRTEALKVLRDRVAVDPYFVSRFRREARACNRLAHENIVDVYDFGRLPDGRLFLAMEYAEGARLDTLLAPGPLEVSRALRIGAQIAAAIAHAHERGVIHRDLKPANVLLVEHRGAVDVVKVLDFGMAKIVAPEEDAGQKLTLRGQTFGTPAYMAPEQFQEPGSDPRSDVYAAGCLLFEMLTGGPPFSGNHLELMYKHEKEEPPRPSAARPTAEIPATIDDIVLRCLAKDPDARYQDAAELRAALESSPAFPKRTLRPTRLPVAMPVAGDYDEAFDTTTATDHGNRRVGDVESPEAIRRAAAEALIELAEALIDLRVGDERLTVAVARMRGHGDEATRLVAERAELIAHEEAHEGSTRTRERSLRFAIGELDFDRGSASAEVRPALDAERADLEQRLSNLLASARRERDAIIEQAIANAAAQAELYEARRASFDALRALVDPLATARESDRELAPLVDRWQGVAAALDRLGARSGS